MSRSDVRTLRREQILDVAERLMAERGWAGVTFAAICREAGVSNGVLTYHFADKEDLLFSLFERQTRHLRDDVLCPAFDSDKPLEERLRLLVGGIATIRTELREFRLLILHFLSLASERPDLAERLEALDKSEDDVIAARLRRDAAAGVVRRDPEAAAAVVSSTFVGFALISGFFDIDPPPEEIVDMLHRYLTSEPTGAERAP